MGDLKSWLMGTAAAVVASPRSKHLHVWALTVAMPAAGLLLTPAPAQAACTVTGSGTLGALNSGDNVDCTGATTSNIQSTTQSNVTVNVGNGSTSTTLTGTAAPGAIFFNATSASNIIVTNGATVDGGPSNAITISNGSSNNAISIAGGATVQSSVFGGAAVGVSGSTGNTINVNGQVIGSSGALGVYLGGGASGNLINVLPGGSISTTSNAIVLDGPGGNTINNEGTIASSTSVPTIWGSGTGMGAGHTVINSGLISAYSASGEAIRFGVNDDVLELRAGSSIIGIVSGGLGTNTLRFGGSANATFDMSAVGSSQQYRQFQEFEKTGSSIWTLTGTYSSGDVIAVREGTLLVNGSLANSVIFVGGNSSTGTIGGDGTVGGLVANFGGTVAPGNSINTIGTLNLSGSVIFGTSTTYQVEINATGQSDKIVAAGTALLSGGTVQIIPLGTGFTANTQYTILTANGGVTGTFAGLAPLDAPLVAGVLQYDPNNVYFLLQQVAGFNSLVGQTPNQKAVAGALDAAQAGGNASGPLTTAINTLAAKSAAGILAGLDDLAGQSLADAHRFTTLQGASFHRLVSSAAGGWSGDVTRFSFGGNAGFAAPMRLGMGSNAPGSAEPTSNTSTGLSGWIGAWGSWDRIDTTANTFGVNANTGGAAAGVELRGTHTTVGAAVGGSSGRLRTAGHNDSVESEMGHAALYARQRWAGFEFDATTSLGYAWLDSSRSIGFLGQTARGNVGAVTNGASFGIARPFLFGGFSATPFASLDWFAARRSSFTETGAPGVNQAVASSTDDVLQGIAGMRLGYRSLPSDSLPWGITARFAVRHDIDGGAPTMRTSLEGAPGAPFVITGADYARTAFVTGAQIDAALSASSTIRLGYDGEFSADRVSHALRGSFQYRF